VEIISLRIAYNYPKICIRRSEIIKPISITKKRTNKLKGIEFLQRWPREREDT